MRFVQPLGTWRRIVAEVILAGILLAFAVGQMASFPLTKDPDPDGYVSYAKHLQAHWALPTVHHRLPGYPTFLALVDLIGPGDMHSDAYWAQLFISAVLLIIMAAVVRHHFGPAVALVFLALFAAPNFFLRYSVVMLADFLTQIFWLVYLAGLAFYLKRSVRVLDWRAATLLGVTTFLIFVTHPGSRYLILILLLSLGLVAFLFRGAGFPRDRLLAFDRRFVGKLSVALVVLVAVTVAADHVYDRGSGAFYRRAVGWRVLMCLPPVRESPVDRRIEEVKDRASARLGYRIEDETPVWQTEFEEVGIGLGDLQKAWMERLRAHPFTFLGCVFDEIRFRARIIVDQFFPFKSERRMLTNARRPSTYRSAGLDGTAPPGPLSGRSRLPGVDRLVTVAVFYGLTGLGIWLLFRRFREVPLALALTALLWVGIVALTVPLEPRLLNLFAPFLYLVHAVAVVLLAFRLWETVGRLCG